MSGLAINTAEEDSGYVSSSTSTIAGDEAKVCQTEKTWSMSSPRSSSRHSSPPLLLSGSPSPDPVASRLACFNISSPTSLSQFPAADADDTISPFCSPPVLLRVGGPHSPSRETQPVAFFVHEKLLTHASTFFRAALSSHSSSNHHHHQSKLSPTPSYSFLEAQTRTIDLPEDRPDDFRCLLQWLYHNSCVRFPPVPDDAAMSGWQPALQNSQAVSCSTANHNDCLSHHAFFHEDTDDDPIIRQLHRHRTYRHQRRLLLPAKRHGDISQLLPPRPEPPAFGPLIRLYVLADKYRVGLGLKDLLCDVVRELAAETNAVPNYADVRLLYDNTLEPSPATGRAGSGGMRKLIIDLYVGMKTEKLLADEDEWHVAFLTDLVQGMRRQGLRNSSGGSDSGGLKDRKRDIEATKKKKNNEAAVTAASTGTDDGGGRAIDGALPPAPPPAEEEKGLIRIGTLRRRRCDYHDHDM